MLRGDSEGCRRPRQGQGRHTQKVPMAQGSPPKKVRRESYQGAWQRATRRTEAGASWQARRLAWLWQCGGGLQRLKATAPLSNHPTETKTARGPPNPETPCCAAVHTVAPEEARHAHSSLSPRHCPFALLQPAGCPAGATSEPGDGLPLSQHRPVSVTPEHIPPPAHTSGPSCIKTWIKECPLER